MQLYGVQGPVGRLQAQFGQPRRAATAQHRAGHGQGQGAVHAAVVLHQQGQAAHPAIGIDRGVDVSCPQVGRRLQRLQVAAMAGPAHQAGSLGGQQRGRCQRGRQLPDSRRARFVGQMKPQHHRAATQHLSQPGIAIGLAVLRGHGWRARARRGRALGFGQHQVKPDQARALAAGGQVQQPGQQVTVPGPAAVGGQRAFVDIDHNNLRLGLARRQHRQLQVVDQAVQLAQRRQFKPTPLRRQPGRRPGRQGMTQQR